MRRRRPGRTKKQMKAMVVNDVPRVARSRGKAGVEGQDGGSHAVRHVVASFEHTLTDFYTSTYMQRLYFAFLLLLLL